MKVELISRHSEKWLESKVVLISVIKGDSGGTVVTAAARSWTVESYPTRVLL